jgi:hypothetical protein
MHQLRRAKKDASMDAGLILLYAVCVGSVVVGIVLLIWERRQRALARAAVNWPLADGTALQSFASTQSTSGA